MKLAIIWRESIYHNDFKCNCGKQLMNDYELSGDILVDKSRNMLICPDCLREVAKLTTEEYALKTKAMKDEVH